ncbi:hypothetical protein PTSG_02934 [Salpingoeca rosetta]|uniref:Uncharacterized protein n=1 Tax=Salpingoeca rosetta (strain ATCC 50818 / BSB-021) TaxID=946362 RepID=F2U3S0_SALR5|nr:uncharacterized protein PTSG_02934 [Salpingoeca rosetta]EGD82264.1 hypothetical protein PTSG_02934 [Salpingoeca rosetta]|eukprot:XP_004996447.1 hypothetical protein PTSG_02934 [Salpingoeca rosetta]
MPLGQAIVAHVGAVSRNGLQDILCGKSRQTMHEDDETRGYTVVSCSADGKLLPGLRGHGLTMAMLTGDKEGTARSIGDRAACRSCRRKGEVVAMVGDGINIETTCLLEVFLAMHLSRAAVHRIHYKVHLGRVVYNATVHTIRQSTSVHVSEIQSIATATTLSPSLVLLWHHFGEGDGFIGTISMPAVLAAYSLTSSSFSLRVSLIHSPLAAGHSYSLPDTVAQIVWDLDKPLSSRSIRGNSGGVHKLRNGERVLSAYALEQ